MASDISFTHDLLSSSDRQVKDWVRGFRKSWGYRSVKKKVVPNSFVPEQVVTNVSGRE